ncbi:hypothetical protein ACGF4C_30740 [Streptomyces sp. NPDC048197]|uniref:hypothetical protein n=1 Tax=Streptomyces sp. NPDC048197 TaxID=3365511 RepID=UPI0037171965
MGVLYGYYAAADDEEAARAVLRDGDRPTGGDDDELVVKGVDPADDLLLAESLITGTAAKALLTTPRRCSLIPVRGGGEVVAVTLTDDFRDALASFDAALLPDVAQGWAAAGDFFTPPDPDSLARFLTGLAALARRAVSRGQHLYCWICP